MSIHCLICGHQENWRDEGEVEVNDNTWVIVRIYRDNLLGEQVKQQRAIEHWWVHRDCMQKLLLSYGVETKLNHNPKMVSEE